MEEEIFNIIDNTRCRYSTEESEFWKHYRIGVLDGLKWQSLEKGYNKAVEEFEHWNLFSDEVLEHKTEQRILDFQDHLLKSISEHKDFSKIKECYIVRNICSVFTFYYILHEGENISELISELEVDATDVKNDVFTVWDLRKSSIKITGALSLSIRKKINVNTSEIFSRTNEDTSLEKAIALLKQTTEYEVVESFREKVNNLVYKNNV